MCTAASLAQIAGTESRTVVYSNFCIMGNNATCYLSFIQVINIRVGTRSHMTKMRVGRLVHTSVTLLILLFPLIPTSGKYSLIFFR
eukprot:g65111.t1